MKLNEYLRKLHQSPIFRSVLPMTQGAIYPMFSVTNGKLCAHILTHKSERTSEGIKAYCPENYLVFTYPDCALVKFEKLAYNPAFADNDFSAFNIIQRPSNEEAVKRRAEITGLVCLADEILAKWDETGEADCQGYNSSYFAILTEKQQEVLKKL